MKMKIYYSGQAGVPMADPETVMQDQANVMLTFYDFYIRNNKPNKRFQRILDKREQRRDDVDPPRKS